MKKIYTVLIILMGCPLFWLGVKTSVFSYQPSDTVIVYPAPEGLPQIKGGWQLKAQNVLETDYDFLLNYGVSKVIIENKDIKAALNEICNTDGLGQTFYDWIIPTLKSKWNQLSYWERAKIYESLKHHKKYVESFSIEKEDNYLAKNTKGFAYYSPDGYWDESFTKPKPIEIRNDYRYIDAMIYRRVKEGVSIEKIASYIDKLLEDITLPKDGTFTTYDVRDQVKEEVHFANGKKEGGWKYYESIRRENVRLVAVKDSGSYANDIKVGTWVQFNNYFIEPQSAIKTQYENGQVKSITYYSYTSKTREEAILEKVITINVNAKEMTTETYENGKVKETKKENL